ncbi:MAG: hypothetical protein KKF68_01600 [Nanoarchaeota archaeon]|nr:hypothetical protein [Nanoarchaeota archaeon]
MKFMNVLIVVAIISVSLAGINLILTIDKIQNAKSITGFATGTGTANLSVSAAASISFNHSLINWGGGSVDETPSFATLDTEGNVVGGTWSALTGGLTVQNDGNTNVTLNISSSNDATDFIGGSAGEGPVYRIRVVENKTGTCSAGTVYPSTYTTFNTTPIIICNNMSSDSSMNLLTIHINITVPEDALGTKGSIITATATAI